MEFENLNMSQITESRRKAIHQSLHPVGLDELKSLEETLFPAHDNPWRDVYFQFLKDNSGSTFYRAATHDGVEIIYCRAKENGMWFIPGNGMGPLQDEGLQIMKEVIDKAKR